MITRPASVILFISLFTLRYATPGALPSSCPIWVPLRPSAPGGPRDVTWPEDGRQLEPSGETAVGMALRHGGTLTVTSLADVHCRPTSVKPLFTTPSSA